MTSFKNERAPQSSQLEAQLASVMEQEGMSISAPDGVRRMAAPTYVEAGARVSRRKRKGYVERPAVSARSEERARDGVADWDRVVVGFADRHEPLMIQKPVLIKQIEHERSPYVVSLRGLTLVGATVAQDERLLTQDLITHAPPDTGGSTGQLETVAALASDLCEEGDEACEEQFTSARTLSTPASDGFINQMAYACWSFVSTIDQWEDRLFARTRAPRSPTANTATPATHVIRIILAMSSLLLIATLPAYAVRFGRSIVSGKNAAVLATQDAIAQAHAATSAPLPQSVDRLRNASSRFREADDVLDSTNALAVGLAGILPQTRTSYRTARSLAEIGSKTSDAGALLAQGFVSALGSGSTSLLDRLSVLSVYAEGALPMLDDAADAFEHVDTAVVPEEERGKLAQLHEGIEQGRVAIREFTGLAGLFAEVLGRSGPRRYLLVFQNPSELRPTGGFMGSFAEITLDKGEITKLVVPPGGTYAVQGQLTARIAPPEPLQLIANRWEFQDANWSPDFAKAAEKIRLFWSASGGPTMDGIVAVNATLVEKLLVLTGPIEVPELGKTISSENFLLETQKAVELEYDREENQPKKILGLLAPRLLERLKDLSQDQMMSAFGLLSSALETKDIQVSLLDPDEQELARRYGWYGQMKQTPGDVLSVIVANVAGQKTDLAIQDRVEHVATIAATGAIEDAVTITRAHTGTKGELFRGVRNVTYIRTYVPAGSTLLEASGFTAPDPSLFDKLQDGLEMDVDEAALMKTRIRHASGIDVWDEGDRTVFGGWSMVDPGSTITLSLRYRLPFTANDLRDRLDTGPASDDQAVTRTAYSLLLTSQSGTPNRRITSRVNIPTGWKTAWGRLADGIDAAWDRDYVMAALYEGEK